MNNNDLQIDVPAKMPNPIATVIKLEIKGKINLNNSNKSLKMKTGELD
ncbi:MAG: hypothetical protein WCK78_18305 [Paludibacter sp.]